MFFSQWTNNKAQTITGAAIILAAASFAARLLGMARDRALAHYFGTSGIMDVYVASFKIPDLIFNLLILGALSVGFIPVLTKLYHHKKLGVVPDQEHKEAWLLVSNVLNILGLALIITSAILMIFTPRLMPFIAPGFSGEKLALTIKMTRIIFLSPILLGLSAVIGSVLQTTKNFLIYSLSPIFYNLGIIFGIIVLVPLCGYLGLAWGVILGALLHLLVQLPAFFGTGYRYHWHWNWRDEHLKTILKLMAPRTLSVAVVHLNTLVITAMATVLAAGTLAVFNYAYNLQSFPVSIAGISFAVAAFPTLSLLAGENKIEEIIKNLSSTIRQILFFIVPLSVIFLLLRAQIVRVILGSGNFDWTSTVRTADTLAFFSLSLSAQALTPLLARAFFALGDTKTPVIAAFVTAAFNIAASWFFTGPANLGWNAEGLAVAFSLTTLLNLALLWVLLRHRLGSLDEGRIVPALLKISVAALGMGLTVQLSKNLIAPLVDMQTFLGIATQGAGAILAGGLIYLAIGLGLRSHEMRIFVDAFKKKLVRKNNLPADITDVNQNI